MPPTTREASGLPRTTDAPPPLPLPGFCLYAWVTDGHEAPRLAVGPRRGRGAIRIASSMQARDTGFDEKSLFPPADELWLQVPSL